MIESKFFSGNANLPLAEKITKSLGIKLNKSEVTKFSDGELQVELLDSVRGQVVRIIQSTSNPGNDNLMELLLLADAARRSGAIKISAIIPYYGYSRQDRRPENTRCPLSSRVVAGMIESVGIDEVIIVDMHSLQQVGFFSIPVINVSAMVALSGDIWRKYGKEKPVIVSPDVGGTARARNCANELNLELAIIDKRRQKANHSEVMNILGDVEGRTCILVDDMVDTAGTLCKGAKSLKEAGAKKVIAYITHPVLSGDAYDTLSEYSEFLDELVVTDTIPIDKNQTKYKNIRVVTVSKLLSEIIRLIEDKKSIGAHFT